MLYENFKPMLLIIFVYLYLCVGKILNARHLFVMEYFYTVGLLHLLEKKRPSTSSGTDYLKINL